MKKTIYTLAILAFCAAFAGCKNNGKPAAQQAAPETVTPLVGVVAATTEIVSDDQTYSSTVQAWAKNNIAPQSGGRIEKLLVEVGNYVNAGQVVAHMDDVQLQQSALQVNNDKVEYARLKSLRDQGGISASDFESFEMACKVHESTYKNLEKNTILRSPISGVISSRNYDQGDMFGMAQPLYTVEQIVPVKLLVGVSESNYTRVKYGDKISVAVDAFPGQTFSGSISNIYPTVDGATHTFNVEVKVANQDRKLRPGMYAKVNLTFDNSSRVVVPDAAVIKQQGSGDYFVYLLNEDSTVSYTKVQVGRRLGSKYVILSGVSEGDKVVTEGILRLKDGAKVRLSAE